MSGDMVTCRQCGEQHTVDSLELTFFRPDAVVELSEVERARDADESDDLCVISGGRFFIRATLPIPVLESETPYRIGVWVEAEEADFRRVYELWNDEHQVNEPPFSVTLANTIPTVQDTRGLGAELRLTGPTTRPEVFIICSGHPLAGQQRHGVTPHRAYEYTASVQK